MTDTEKQDKKLEAFTHGALVALLWSEVDNQGIPLDSTYDQGDMDSESLARFKQECFEFFAENTADLLSACQQSGYGWGHAGHDYTLTRNGHGAGYWDGDIIDLDLGEKLTDAALKFGEVSLFVSDDGVVCAEFSKRPARHDISFAP